MKIQIWSGGRLDRYNRPILNPPETIDCIDERGGIYLYQHREDWFELFENGTRRLSAMWTRQMAEDYRDRLLNGESHFDLQAEIDSNYRLLGGLRLDFNIKIRNVRRSMIEGLYGDREKSERFASDEERISDEERARRDVYQPPAAKKKARK